MKCFSPNHAKQMGNGPPNRMMMFNPRQPNMLGNPRMAAANIPPNVRMTQQQVQQQQQVGAISTRFPTCFSADLLFFLALVKDFIRFRVY